MGPPAGAPNVEIYRTTDFPTDSTIRPSGRIRVTGASFVLRRAGAALADTRGGPDPASAPVRTEPGDVLELYVGADATTPAYVLSDVGLPTIERCRVRERTIAGRLPAPVSPMDSDAWTLFPLTGAVPVGAGQFSFALPRALHRQDELTIKSTRVYPSRVIVTATATRVAGFCVYGIEDGAAEFEPVFATTRGAWIQGRCHGDSHFKCPIEVTARFAAGPLRGRPAMPRVRRLLKPGTLLRNTYLPWNRRLRALIAAHTAPPVEVRLQRFHPEGRFSAAAGDPATSCTMRPRTPRPAPCGVVRKVPWKPWPRWAGPIPGRTVPL